MRIILQVVEKIVSEAHINIPDMFCQDTIKQHIVELYNSGAITTDLNICQVDFESISATIVSNQESVDTQENAA
ncbi:hypothetical protein NIES2109_61550 (plasmid) [Nostoc sp. HK-01]|nr:hypothetical protein NIES2109_61550 [Nostoc sp. HK-01]